MARHVPSVSVEQMREVDRLMVEEFDISIMQMMENAGRLLASVALQEFPDATFFSILCGKGNNGGDGLVTARHLHNQGKIVEVVLADDNLNEIGMHQLKSLRVLQIPIRNSIEQHPEVIIDALLWYSTVGAPRGIVAELIEQANGLNVPIISFDIPSGWNPLSQTFLEPSFKDVIVCTLGLPKHGLIDNPRIKKLYVLDISIPIECYARIGVEVKPFFNDEGFYVF